MPTFTQTATGRLAIPLTALGRLLANSANFQTAVSAVDAASAWSRIYLIQASDELDPESPPGDMQVMDPRPRAVAYFSEGFRVDRQGLGGWIETGAVHLSIELVPPKEYRGNFAEESVWFMNHLGGIFNDLMTYNGQRDANDDPYLNITSIAVADGPGPCDEPEEYGYFWCALLVVGYVH